MGRDNKEHNRLLAEKKLTEAKRVEGESFFDLTVIKVIGGGRKEGIFALFKCKCGAKIERPLARVRSGRIKSCPPCGKKRRGSYLVKENCVSKERLHGIWSGIKTRCNNKNNKSYASYGGRGIKVCPEWSESYLTFREWSLSNGYKDNLSIDRIDNDKGYSPDNCRWTTRRTQTLNSRLRSDNKTGERCITESRGKFQLTIDGKYYGIFDNIKDAVIERNSILKNKDKRILR